MVNPPNEPLGYVRIFVEVAKPTEEAVKKFNMAVSCLQDIVEETPWIDDAQEALEYLKEFAEMLEFKVTEN